VTRGAENALEVPNSFSGLGVYLVKKPATIVLVEYTRKSPWLMLEGLHILNFNKQDITRFGFLDLEWSREVVNLSQVDVPDIIGTVVVLDLTTSPIETFNLDRLSVLDGTTEGHVRMPTVLPRSADKH
jgi:hypothetical protein